MNEMSPFATEIMQNRYAHDITVCGVDTNGQRTKRKETWKEIAWRTSKCVLGALLGQGDYSITRTANAIHDRKFMPGGRYLYASGRPYHQTQNCLLMRAHDSREGWGSTMDHVT